MIYRVLLIMSMGMVAVTGALSHKKPASTRNSVPAVQKTSFPGRD
jgi:hypothetical protein